MCTRWENFIRIGITVLYLKSCRCQLWIWRSQVSVLLTPLRVASKTAFATVKFTIDTSNSSNTVLLFLKYVARTLISDPGQVNRKHIWNIAETEVIIWILNMIKTEAKTNWPLLYCHINRIGGVMVSAFASNLVHHMIRASISSNYNYTIGICCFSAKHTSLVSKRNNELGQNQSGMVGLPVNCYFSELALLKNLTKHVGLVQKRGHHHHLINMWLALDMI